jgi:hypothetical protein
MTFGSLHLGNISLYFLIASVAFLLNCSDTRCMSANSLNEWPVCVPGQYVMSFPKLTLLQTDSKCNTY